MAQRGQGQVDDVVGHRVVAAVECGQGAGGLHQGDARSGRRPQVKLRPLPRQADQRVDVVDQLGVHQHIATLPGRLDDLFGPGHSPKRLEPAVELDLDALLGDDLDLLLGRRVVDHELEHEAVELRLGQVVSALGLDRVLRGQHQEGPLDPMARPLDRHSILLHDLQQRGVRFGGRAVDLVGQKELGEDRAGAEPELLRLHVEHG